jgi:hypothetical protein
MKWNGKRKKTCKDPTEHPENGLPLYAGLWRRRPDHALRL